ncbi:unnamed protein product [Rangifer tarandus platyrhynchus]|uniref:Uncharacterized protein n=1 Tax=Rangifer tarandus platyrhynchus TaxID=3082113 RepID=A0AC59YKA6_RANTA
MNRSHRQRATQRAERGKQRENVWKPNGQSTHGQRQPFLTDVNDRIRIRRVPASLVVLGQGGEAGAQTIPIAASGPRVSGPSSAATSNRPPPPPPASRRMFPSPSPHRKSPPPPRPNGPRRIACLRCQNKI